MSDGIYAVILAGGRSKRMGGGLPKPLRKVGGKTLLNRVASSLALAGIARERMVIVVSPDFDRSAAGLDPWSGAWTVQPEAKGTGDAARCGLGALGASGNPGVLIALADVPFTRPASYKALVQGTPESGISFMTGELEQPGSLGRVVRGPKKEVVDIVEFKELAPGQESIREINVGHFFGRKGLLLDLIGGIKPGAKGGELYLTSIVALAKSRGLPVEGIRAVRTSEALGANTPEELEALARMAEEEGE